MKTYVRSKRTANQYEIMYVRSTKASAVVVIRTWMSQLSSTTRITRFHFPFHFCYFLHEPNLFQWVLMLIKFKLFLAVSAVTVATVAHSLTATLESQTT